MGRGVSSGGGQSSLGYLFGSCEVPKPASTNVEAPKNPAPVESNVVTKKPTGASPPSEATKQIPSAIQGNNANNYFRADGQNSGNFLTFFLCVAVGLWAGLIIGFVTEYFTSNAYSPVQDVAESCRTAMYGIALVALGMLSTIESGQGNILPQKHKCQTQAHNNQELLCACSERSLHR